MITLAIDASTYVGDVAVLRDDVIAAEASVAMRGAEQEHLMPAVASVLATAGVDVRALDRIVCGAGPGSFTSLRIAGAIAKGIASAIHRPLSAVSSLALVVAGADLAPGSYLVALDALRGEYYVGLFDVARSDGDTIVERRPARLVPLDEIEPLAAEFDARIVSPSSLPGGVQAMPRAHGVLRLQAQIQSSGAVDIGSWEPAYGRLAEAQVKWEQAHGRPLTAG